MKHRKLKACLLLLLIPVLLLALYAILDFPLLPTVAKYRLAEKAAMVGPGNILGISTVKHSVSNAYYEVVAARTDHAVLLYDGTLYYRKDLGEPVILVAGSRHTATSSSISLPLILFDEFPEAVRAEIEIEIIPRFAGSEDIGTKIRLEATREHDGFFLFTLKNSDGLDLINLQHFSQGDDLSTRPIPVELWLYDKDGNQIAAVSLEILSPGIIAHRERGDYEPGHGIGG